ncbi:MAG: hypothetical protein AAGA60_24475 [Cyanobacteria bacterium P01_E01_bin.42]
MATDKNSVAIDSIYGVWYREDRFRDEGYLLIRETERSHGWGQKYEFQKTGEFVDEYSAPCGNDEQLHHWQGLWMWNEKMGILLLQVRIKCDTRYGSLHDSIEERSRGYWQKDSRIFIDSEWKERYCPPEGELQEYLLHQELYIDEISRERLILKPIPSVRE